MIQQYLQTLAADLVKTDMALLTEIGQHILATKQTGARIFTVGNGGSAATASHFCNDLIKGCRVDNKPGFKAYCLCDPMPVLTCLSNDFSYEDVFALQLETHAQPGDILIAFSGSGNSPNVLRAVAYARKIGMTVMGFSGRDGGALKPVCDRCCIAPTWSMEALEDMHLCYCHALVVFLRESLTKIDRQED